MNSQRVLAHFYCCFPALNCDAIVVKCFQFTECRLSDFTISRVRSDQMIDPSLVDHMSFLQPRYLQSFGLLNDSSSTRTLREVRRDTLVLALILSPTH